MATNGGRTNIFMVSGYGAQKLPEGHPGTVDSEDAPGELDLTSMAFGGSARSSFALAPPAQRNTAAPTRA